MGNHWARRRGGSLTQHATVLDPVNEPVHDGDQLVVDWAIPPATPDFVLTVQFVIDGLPELPPTSGSLYNASAASAHSYIEGQSWYARIFAAGHNPSQSPPTIILP